MQICVKFSAGSLVTALLLTLAMPASAINYSAPGNPYKIRVFSAQTDEKVCVSRENSCDLAAGDYYVKLIDENGKRVGFIDNVMLRDEYPSGTTLAQLDCLTDQIAQYDGFDWVCADVAEQNDIDDVMALVETAVCIDDEELMRNDDGTLTCGTSCPYIEYLTERGFPATGDLDDVRDGLVFCATRKDEGIRNVSISYTERENPQRILLTYQDGFDAFEENQFTFSSEAAAKSCTLFLGCINFGNVNTQEVDF